MKLIQNIGKCIPCIRCVKMVSFLVSPVGLYYCFNNLSDATIFIIMYGVTSMYFSAVMVRHFNFILVGVWSWFIGISIFMEALALAYPICSSQVRLMLVLAPVMCILSGIGVSQVLTTYMKNLDVSRPDKKSKKQQDSTYPIKNEVRTTLRLIFPSFVCAIGSLWVMLCSDWSVGGEWDDSGHGIFPHHIHFPLHLGDQRGLLLPLHRALSPRGWRQPHHLRWLQRGLLLAQTQHTGGQWDQSCHRPS